MLFVFKNVDSYKLSLFYTILILYILQDTSQSNDSGNENELMSLLQKDKHLKSTYFISIYFYKAVT